MQRHSARALPVGTGDCRSRHGYIRSFSLSRWQALESDEADAVLARNRNQERVTENQAVICSLCLAVTSEASGSASSQHVEARSLDAERDPLCWAMVEP